MWYQIRLGQPKNTLNQYFKTWNWPYKLRVKTDYWTKPGYEHSQHKTQLIYVYASTSEIKVDLNEVLTQFQQLFYYQQSLTNYLGIYDTSNLFRECWFGILHLVEDMTVVNSCYSVIFKHGNKIGRLYK